MFFFDRKLKFFLLILSIVVAACEEDTSDTTISQFEGPKDVALVCYDSEKGKPLPLSCCGKSVTLDDGNCNFGVSTANLYAFITQTTPGEVAVVDVEDQSIVDQERKVPYNSFIPVGGQPNDIAATTDGTKVYTANYETGDLSIIRVVDEEKGYSVIDSPFLSPANSIDLGGPAARIALVKHPEKYEDSVAIVTQPTLSRIAVIALNSENCPNPDKQIDGCVKGYVNLDKIGVSNEETGEIEEKEMHPEAISSADGQSIYVGSYDTTVLVDIQLESLVVEALSMSEPGEIDPEKVINEVIQIAPYNLRSLSIEPKKRRWLYGIDHKKGAVVALDLGGRVPGSGEKIVMKEVSMNGLPRAVKVLELSEDAEPDPFTFNGTFAIVTTTLARLAVVDIEDNDLYIKYFHPHSIRSMTDLADEDDGVQKLDEPPELSIDSYDIKEGQVDDYIQLVEDDIDAGVGCDAGAEFKEEYDEGIRFRCDPYESKQQYWYLKWRGPIGLSGTGVIVNISEKNNGRWKLLNEDTSKDFCASELYTENSVEGYSGDRLIITSEPTPLEGAEDICEELYGDDPQLVYRIVAVSKYRETDDNPNVIEFVKDNKYSADLLSQCYGKSIQFEIYARDHWTIRGSSSSYSKTEGSFSEEKNACVYEQSEKSKLRVYEGQTFENEYLIFKMKYGEKWKNGPHKTDIKENDTDTDVEATLSFEIVDGYEEMSYILGATNITDIEVSPDGDLLLVDQGGEGLITFDLVGEFDIVGNNVN